MCPDNDTRDRWCPACGTHHKWYETTCPSCGGALVHEGAKGAPDPAVALVSVFHISDGAVVPLATMALEGAGIEYEIRAKNIIMPGVVTRGPEHTGFDVDVPGDIVVRAEDAVRARDLLTDLQNPAPPASADPTQAEWEAPAAATDPDRDAE